MEALMLAKCLNPQCDARFRYLNQGRIFNIDFRALGTDASHYMKRTERFWLCQNCCQTMKVVVDNGTVATTPLEPAEIVSSLEREEEAIAVRSGIL
jgi:hypothetical protein